MSASQAECRGFESRRPLFSRSAVRVTIRLFHRDSTCQIDGKRCRRDESRGEPTIETKPEATPNESGNDLAAGRNRRMLLAGVLAVFGLGLCAVGGWIALSSDEGDSLPAVGGGKLGDAAPEPEEPEPPPAKQEARVVEFSAPPPVPPTIPKPVEKTAPVAVAAAAPAPEAPAKRVVIVSVEQAAVRNGSDIAITVAQGERLTVEQVQSPWILVSTPKRKEATAWIRDDGVKKINQSTVEIKTATVAAKLPDGTKFPVTVGEKFIISHVNSPWYLVTVPTASLTGWVKESDVKDEK